MTDRPLGADCAALSSDVAALPVEVIAPGAEFTAHGNTVLPIGVLQPDGTSCKPAGRVVLSPDERARLIARLLEHEGLEAQRIGIPRSETVSLAEVVAITGQDQSDPEAWAARKLADCQAAIEVPGPVRALAVDVARLEAHIEALEAHIEELEASRDKMAAQIAEDIVRRDELDAKHAALVQSSVRSLQGAVDGIEAWVDRRLTRHKVTEEDPHAINATFDCVDQRLEVFERNIQSLRNDVSALQGDVSVLQRQQ